MESFSRTNYLLSTKILELFLSLLWTFCFTVLSDRATSNLGEGVDSQNGQVRLRLGVVHQVQVDQLLELQVVCLHAVDHIREEGADVLAHRHAGDNLLDGLFLLLLLFALQVNSQFGQLTWKGREHSTSKCNMLTQGCELEGKESVIAVPLFIVYLK